MVCAECQITLCVRCYIPFYTVPDLVGNKRSMGVLYQADDLDEFSPISKRERYKQYDKIIFGKMASLRSFFPSFRHFLEISEALIY